MPRIYAERVRESCLVVGTGPVQLLGSLAGPWRTFAAVMAQGDTCTAMIVSQTTGQWEMNVLTRIAADALERAATPLASSAAGGARVAFAAAGDQQVFLAASAQDVGRVINGLETVETAAAEAAAAVAAINSKITVSTDPPAGGAEGDIWLQTET